MQIVIDFNLSSPPKPTQIRPAKLVESRHLYTAARLKIVDILFSDISSWFILFHYVS
jgi:hypothetical protein